LYLAKTVIERWCKWYQEIEVEARMWRVEIPGFDTELVETKTMALNARNRMMYPALRRTSVNRILHFQYYVCEKCTTARWNDSQPPLIGDLVNPEEQQIETKEEN
jgi:hypothetical protein